MVKKTALDYAKQACDTMMKIPAEKLPPVGEFHYHQGVFLKGMQKVYHCCAEEKYYTYCKKWIDSVISENGEIKNYKKEQLDDMMAGILLFDLYKREEESRYREVLKTLIAALKNWRRNECGGFWHKDIRPNQMWLDGLFMYGPLAAQYGKMFCDDSCFDLVEEQINLMWDNMLDKRTGLLKHAWDQSRDVVWADPVTGLAPEFWGRAIGWYAAAILDVYEFAPQKYRKNIAAKAQQLLKSVVKYRNLDNGLWYQVVNKGNEKGNWCELSCSCLFVYGICKACRLGILERSYLRFAQKGYEGIVSMLQESPEGDLLIGNVCVGTGVGQYEYYINRPTAVNDLHGVGAFLYMATEYESTVQE